ncbi:uncharacterized protein TA07870 [Theileria annulata]|uniref:Uncharacterized protein n=1 Tax=Theileria annulata TaxID=5874 RepID=Q4U9Y0_THEAN|nr:uncharacterized protein TA07870 [Theileria annulata]CAI76373.1 hypothetical protein TA07870 [Theileria annulata]|eukprot:XP_952998.1 hypothetical protein TA07870 [Theileria annulata]
MKIVFAFFLLINFVRCHYLPDFSFFRIKNYPKITQNGNRFVVNFEILLGKEFKLRDLRAKARSSFVLSLLYPLNLELSHHGELRYAGDVDKAKNASTTHDSYPVMLDNYGTDQYTFRGYSAMDIVFNVDSKFSKAMGINDSTTLKTEISSVTSTKGLVLDLYFRGDTLKRGVYNFTAVFQTRRDLSTTEMKSYYDEFVLALGYSHEGSKKAEGMKCLTKSPLAGAIMIKHFQERSLQCLSCSYYLGYELGDPKHKFPIVKKINVTGNVEHEPKTGSSFLTVKLTMDDKLDSDMFSSATADIVIDLPKSISGLKLDESKVCKPEFTPKLHFVTCKYDAEKGRVTYNMIRSHLELQITLSIKIDISGSDIVSYLSSNKSNELTTYVYYNVNSDKIEVSSIDIPKTIQSTNKYVGLTESFEPIVKELLGQLIEHTSTKKYLLYAGTTKVELSKLNPLIYTISKIDDLKVMRMYLPADPKFASQKLKLNITLKNFGEDYLGLPTEKDYAKNKLLPRNKGVSRRFKGVSVEFNYGPVLRDEDKNKFSEITLVFRSRHNDLMRLYSPGYLNFSLSNRSGDIPLLVYPRPPLLTSDVYTAKSSKVMVTGPHLERNPDSVLMQFMIKTTISKATIFHFKFDKTSNRLFGKYLTGKMNNEFDGISTVQTDGLKYVEFFLDPSYKDTEYNLKIDITVNTKGLEQFPFDKMTLYVEEEPKFKGIIFRPQDMTGNIFTQEYSLEELNHLEKDSVPCLSADTKFSSSMFRSGDNATYIFARLFDCKKPWLLSKSYSSGDLSVSLGEKEKEKGYHVTVTEPLSLAYPDKALPAMVLSKQKRFYEHILYIFLDEMAVKTIRKQMIAAKTCVAKDAVCIETAFVKMLEKFFADLFEDEKELSFSKAAVRYYDSSKKLHLLTLSSDKKLTSDGKELSDYTLVRDAFEHTLDEAFAHSHAEKMGSSFSVIAVVDNTFVYELKNNLTTFVPNRYGPSVNGIYQHPVFVDIIPVNNDSNLLIGGLESSCTKIPVITRDTLKTYDEVIMEIDMEKLENTVFTSYQFKNVAKPLQVTPKLPLGRTSTIEFKRDDFKLFFGISELIPRTCVKELGKAKTPVYKAIKEAVNYAKESTKSYHVIATCASFGNNELSKAESTYLLTFKDVVLGKYTVIPKDEGPDKMLSECDIFSLYKYMPDTPHSEVSEDSLHAVPSKVKTSKVEDDVQIVESGEKAVEMTESYKKHMKYVQLQKTIGQFDFEGKQADREEV